MATKVQNADKSAAVTGLIDTGCNTELLSSKACRELGIEHQITPHKSFATVVDGKNLSILGSVFADLWIGDVRYKSRFSVIEHIAGYDVMVGTSFMKKSGLLEDIFEAAKRRLGAENVRKGN